MSVQLVFAFLSAAGLLLASAAPAGQCFTHEFHCSDGPCVGFEYVCDGLNHCTDGSDERHCGNITADSNNDANATTPLETDSGVPLPVKVAHRLDEVLPKFTTLVTYLLPPNPSSENDEPKKQ